VSWFFGGALTSADVARIRFGDEGQYWTLMPAQAFVAHARAVPYLRQRLRDFLAVATV
jgi:8-oxo-dGTP diphosphatase